MSAINPAMNTISNRQPNRFEQKAAHTMVLDHNGDQEPINDGNRTQMGHLLNAANGNKTDVTFLSVLHHFGQSVEGIVAVRPATGNCSKTEEADIEDLVSRKKGACGTCDSKKACTVGKESKSDQAVIKAQIKTFAAALKAYDKAAKKAKK